jgi:formylmethanofuran dehydrogenase subunit E
MNPDFLLRRVMRNRLKPHIQRSLVECDRCGTFVKLNDSVTVDGTDYCMGCAYRGLPVRRRRPAVSWSL